MLFASSVLGSHCVMAGFVPGIDAGARVCGLEANGANVKWRAGGTARMTGTSPAMTAPVAHDISHFIA